MDRRNFFKLMAVAGVATAAPEKKLSAQSGDKYEGPYFLMVNAGGGWDPTSLCDPKGGSVNAFNATDIKSIGNLRYAPILANNADAEATYDKFFNTYYKQMIVLNGVDAGTNSHALGQRATWGGDIATPYPSFGALLAAAKNKRLPLAFLSSGGYSETDGVVSLSRGDEIDPIVIASHPNIIDRSKGEAAYLDPSTIDRILNARIARIQHISETHKLPAVRRAAAALFTVAAGTNELKLFSDTLPSELKDGRERQVQIAMAAFKSGLGISAQISVGGFDTHGNHDQRHSQAMDNILKATIFAMEEAERQGIADKVVIVMGSEFGRTPTYGDGKPFNANNGKDHWPISSMIILGEGIRGDRTFGASSDTHAALTVNPTTGVADEGGVKVTPAHVHLALRDYFGISDLDIVKLYPLLKNDGNWVEKLTIF